MHLPADSTPDTPRQRLQDRARLRRSVQASVAAAVLLSAVHGWQSLAGVDWHAGAIAPRTAGGLLAVLSAPLLHGSGEHLLMNAIGVVLLGTLAGLAHPKATVRALPLLWLGSGLGAWLLGEPGSHHLGASGVTHGLMFLVFALGLLRRDRASIAAGMLAFAFYGGMLLTVLPQEVGVSWQSHLGGALAGIVAAFAFRRSDPAPPRARYSWELEEEHADAIGEAEDAQLEPPRPDTVPVLWRRDAAPARDGAGVVLRFPDRDD